MPSPGKQVIISEALRESGSILDWLFKMIVQDYVHTKSQMVVGGAAIIAAATGGYFYAKRWYKAKKELLSKVTLAGRTPFPCLAQLEGVPSAAGRSLRSRRRRRTATSAAPTRCSRRWSWRSLRTSRAAPTTKATSALGGIFWQRSQRNVKSK